MSGSYFTNAFSGLSRNAPLASLHLFVLEGCIYWMGGMKKKMTGEFTYCQPFYDNYSSGVATSKLD